MRHVYFVSVRDENLFEFVQNAGDYTTESFVIVNSRKTWYSIDSLFVVLRDPDPPIQYKSRDHKKYVDTNLFDVRY